MSCYPMICDECEYEEDWDVSFSEYEKLIENAICPNCKKGKLRQNFAEKFKNGFVYIYNGNPDHWVGRNLTSKTGSQEALDDALRENDYWLSGKDIKQKKKADEIKEQQDKLGLD